MNLAQAKQKLTVPQLWEHFHFPGKASASCLCPFHEDHSPSFSVREDGAVWHCFAGCGGGDVVDFFELATGLNPHDACLEFIRLAGGHLIASGPPARKAKHENPESRKLEQRQRWPMLEDPLAHPDDTPARAMAYLAKQRHVSLAGIKLMAHRGLLRFAAWKDLPAWIVTDGERVNAQARRMDGKLWQPIDKKAQTLPGSKASWPIGLPESARFPFILLCEGGPDLLAAHHFIVEHGREVDTASIGIMGASNDIPPDLAKQFANKRVRIMAHADDAGRKAAEKWAAQLAGCGASVDAVDLTGLRMTTGDQVKDLNDLTRLHPEQVQELETLIPR